MTTQKLSCEIFCNVVDNYGDIGVCWRLARQLSCEHCIVVRLWVDDLTSLTKLCPEANAGLDSQVLRGVQVRRWCEQAFHQTTRPADIVIAAFACKLPDVYVQAMAQRTPASVWINLEYLSAEDWVQGCHGLPSPHPRLPLTQYFFFPGFTKQTGGLLLERDVLARRDAFFSDAAAQCAFWQSLGMDVPTADTLRVSLFAYENAALPALLDAWVHGAQSLLCLVPEGLIVPQLAQYFAALSIQQSPMRGWQHGNLQVRVLPFVAQEDYDLLLWACDVNFVRGEDSCVRAQWAGKPFIWQIYPQHDKVHLEKLQALQNLYCTGLSDTARAAVQGVWQLWNADAAQQKLVEGALVAAHWTKFIAARAALANHTQDWARQLAENSLAWNLLDFCQKIGKIRAFQNDRQST